MRRRGHLHLENAMNSICRLISLAAILAFPAAAIAQETHHGYHGAGHEKLHADFYSKLVQPGSKQSCCNLADCRPTSIRAAGDHYEIEKDGRWIRVDPSKIVKELAPDGGAHICAPESYNTRYDPDFVFCIIMPQEI